VGHCGGMTRDEAPGQWANDLNITLEPAMGTVSGASPGGRRHWCIRGSSPFTSPRIARRGSTNKVRLGAGKLALSPFHTLFSCTMCFLRWQIMLRLIWSHGLSDVLIGVRQRSKIW
jgi:hypothetical protein